MDNLQERMKYQRRLAITDNNLLQNEGDTSVKDENDIDEFNYESPLPITIEIECDQLSLSENDEVDKFLCVVCNKVFNTVAEQHEHTHSPVVYTTDLPEKKRHPKETELNDHDVLHCPPSVIYAFVCDYPHCLMNFRTQAELIRHQKQHDPPLSNSFTCTICNASFKTAAERTRHIDSHSVVNTFKCTRCGKSFPYYVTLTNHYNECESPYQCGLCLWFFFSNEELLEHEKAEKKMCMCKKIVCRADNCSAHTAKCVFYTQYTSSYGWNVKKAGLKK